MLERLALNFVLLASLVFAFVPVASAKPADAVSGAVFASQLGFAPNDPRSAVLAVPTGTTVERSFRVVDAAEATFLAFSSAPADMQLYQGGWSGNNVTGDTYRLDFSNQDRWTPAPSGRYVVESNGLRSQPFLVGSGTYDARPIRPLEFFRVQRSGDSVSWQALDGAGSHGPDHLDDARQASRKDGGGGDAKLIEQDYLPPSGRPQGHNRRLVRCRRLQQIHGQHAMGRLPAPSDLRGLT